MVSPSRKLSSVLRSVSESPGSGSRLPPSTTYLRLASGTQVTSLSLLPVVIGNPWREIATTSELPSMTWPPSRCTVTSAGPMA